MIRPPLKALYLVLLAATLFSVAATPDVADGPANLRAEPGGDVLTVLETGTPLAVTDVACLDGAPWIRVSIDGQTGWMAAELVGFGDGAAAHGPADAQLELRSEPFGEVQALVQPSDTLTAVGLQCTENSAWLQVRIGATQGWVLGDFVSFGGAAAPAPAPTPSAIPDQSSPTPDQQPPATPAPTSAPPTAPSGSGPYVAASPEYGMGVFVWGRTDALQTMKRVSDMQFGWQKSLLRWRDVESAGKGQFDWTGSDSLIQESNAAGLKMIARVDFQPSWARKDSCVQDLNPPGCANNGPPDNYQDYADFIFALVSRYKTNSPNGHLHAIEVWNEPNLSREWGNKPVNEQQAKDYVRLLSLAYDAAKRADPSVTVVTAGLSPTGWNDDTARPDDTYLQWLYAAGMKGHFDALGAHGPGFKAPPEVSPAEAAANPTYGGHRSFTFRRIEDLRAIMEANGDSAKQIWVLEFGWTSDEVNQAYAWHRVSEQEKADYLVRAFQWAHAHWSPWIGVMTVWNMPDSNWGPQDEQYWWGITNPDGSPRLAYTELQNARRDGSLP